MSKIFSRYMARQFVFWFLALLIGLLVIIFFAELTEQLRRAADKPQVTFNLSLKMALLKLPDTGEKVLPFVTLFAGMYCFSRLTRNQELIVARASGISVWQFMGPVVIATIFLGIFNLAIVNPISAVMIKQYHKLEDRYLAHSTMLDITSSGLWLRQLDNGRQTLLHADGVTGSNPFSVRSVLVLMFDERGQYTGRIDALNGTLKPDAWELSHAWINKVDSSPEQANTYTIPTVMNSGQIQESLAAPDTLPIWRLPSFIATLEQMGFSALHHRLYFWSLILQPVLLSAMILFAAAFSLRHNRRGGILILIAVGVVTGFVIYAMNDVILALGMNQTLPVFVSSSAVPVMSWLLGCAILLNFEDG